MSTRAQAILTDGHGELWFYRHSDGYPEGVKKSLDEFCEMVNTRKIRDNVEQAGGWLIEIGRREYADVIKSLNDNGVRCSDDWKIGEWEPSNPRCHGDIDHLYRIEIGKGCTGDATWSEISIAEQRSRDK